MGDFMRDFIYRGRRIQSVGFFGFGRSNLGVREYLDREFSGLRYVLRSDGPCEAMGFERVTYGDGAYAEPYEDVVFISPGVRRDRPGLLTMAERGVILSSDAELFCECADLPIFAVSGSDGKSTTVTLASRMLGAPAIGNIGVAMSPFIGRGALPCVVAELSSFQLTGWEPSVYRAVITNISPNHLDWHRSYEEYISAKENLLKGAAERVFNLDCEVSRGLAGRYRADIAYSAKMSAKEMQRTVKAEVYIGISGDHIEANGVKILHTGAIQLKNEHNLSNILCAISLVYGHAKKDDIECVASEFSGLSHRCEEVGKWGGVRYIDSSIDSTPKRCATTLSSLSGEWVVILGGRSKGLDYREIIEPLRAQARLAVLTGESGKEIEQILRGSGIRYIYEADFERAVTVASEAATGAAGVILSPASTSFDRFSSFEERGNYFKKIIRKLHNED